MNYNTFRDRFHRFRIFSVKDIRKSFPEFDSRRLVEWQQKGYILKIINRWYLFSDIDIDDNMRIWIANRIYQPSYISMESALSYYNLIPESVYTVTSLTSRKTLSFNTKAGTYNYRHIKSSTFFGYQVIEWKGFPLKIAEVEKVLLDYLYLNNHINSKEDLENLRLNITELKEKLNLEKFNRYLLLFNSNSLKIRANALLKFLDLC